MVTGKYFRACRVSDEPHPRRAATRRWDHPAPGVCDHVLIMSTGWFQKARQTTSFGLLCNLGPTRDDTPGTTQCEKPRRPNVTHPYTNRGRGGLPRAGTVR